MITIRLSQDMMKKLGLTIRTRAEPAADPVCDWVVHLYRHQRRQYILVCNSKSLFTVTFPGRGVTNQTELVERLLPALREQHVQFELRQMFDETIAPQAAQVTWSKTGDRSVAGSMVDMMRMAKYALDGGDPSPFELSLVMNDNILSYIGYQTPPEAHRKLAHPHG